jgi:hypothetical protein
VPIRMTNACGYCERPLPLDDDGVREDETMPSPIGRDRLHFDCSFSFVPDEVVDDDADAVYERYVDREIGV